MAVVHPPLGISKWDKIGPRLVAFVTIIQQRKPFVSNQIIV